MEIIINMSKTFRICQLSQFYENLRSNKMLFVTNIVLFLTFITGEFPIADCQGYEIVFGSYVYVDVVTDLAVIDTVPGVSFDDCKKLCWERYDCWTLNYHVTAHICYNTREYTLATPAYDVQRRSNFISAHKIQEVPQWDYDYTPYYGCGYLPYVDQTHKLGNMRTVGSKVKYVCDEREDKSDVIECLSDNTWSMTSLSCDKGDECVNAHTWGLCYHLTPLMMHWDATKTECQTMGGYLADITDENEMNHVIDYLRSHGAFGIKKVFIGLNNRKNMTEYRRINGEVATYFYGNNSGFVSLSTLPQTTTTTTTTTNEDKKSTKEWPVASTDSVIEDDKSGRRFKRCVSMVMANDLKWMKTDCVENHASLCEKEGDCDQMACYWFEEKKAPWLKAQENCEDHDAHLADITNEEEMRLVSTFLDSFTKLDKTSNIYIGINNRANITEYRMTNDTVATYFNWLIESTTSPTTMYPADSVNYGGLQGIFNFSVNDRSEDENGGQLNSSPRTDGADPDQDGSLESGAIQERCVAIDLETGYSWVKVDCNDILKGLCEIDATYSYL